MSNLNASLLNGIESILIDDWYVVTDLESVYKTVSYTHLTLPTNREV